MYLRPGLALLALTVLAAPARADETPPAAPAAAWQAASRGLFREAHDALEPATDRASRLGTAVMLLQLQPRTAARVARSAELLALLAEEDPRDEPGIAARYFLGRLEQAHRQPARPADAAAHYRRLLAEHPAHPLAGQALVKLAILELYPVQPAETRAALYADYSVRAITVADPQARGDLHLLLGETALRFGLDRRSALAHFVAGLEQGISRDTRRADTLVRVGELARALGDADRARSVYERFLAEFPRDDRRLTVREHLAALPAPPPAASSGSSR